MLTTTVKAATQTPILNHTNRLDTVRFLALFILAPPDIVRVLVRNILLPYAQAPGTHKITSYTDSVIPAPSVRARRQQCG